MFCSIIFSGSRSVYSAWIIDGFSSSVLENSSGYSLTKVDANRYTFSASSGTATYGNTQGGGENASAGPVTVSA